MSNEVLAPATPVSEGFPIFTILLSVLGVGIEVFTLWMLVHAITKPIAKKGLWIAVILLIPGIGALVYFFVGRKTSTEAYLSLAPPAGGAVPTSAFQPNQVWQQPTAQPNMAVQTPPLAVPQPVAPPQVPIVSPPAPEGVQLGSIESSRSGLSSPRPTPMFAPLPQSPAPLAGPTETDPSVQIP